MNEADDKLMAIIQELRKTYPHWRLGQLVANVAGWADTDAWDVEDDQLLAAAERHLASRHHRQGMTFPLPAVAAKAG